MKEYTFHSKIILRTPLLPVQLNLDKQYIIEAASTKKIQEALYLSSPILYKKFKDWQHSKSLDKKEEDRLMASLRKYLLRMQTRCTPFGLFASCAVLQWGKESNISLKTVGDLARRTRLDMHFLCELIQYITNHPSFQDHLIFYPNNSIYSSFDRYRYVEAFLKDSIKYHQLSSVYKSAYLEKVINFAINGKTLKELAVILVDKDITLEEAHSFIAQLEPNVTGTDILERILLFLSRCDLAEAAQLYDILTDIRKSLHKIDSTRINGIQPYIDLQTKINKIGIKFEESKLIQTDSFRQIKEAVLSNKVQGQIKKAGIILAKLSHEAKETPLQKFKDNFLERYEEAEKPLAEVLDTERGIGYLDNSKFNVETPFVEDIGDSRVLNSQKINWSTKEAFLFRIAQEAIYSKQAAIDLSIYEETINTLDYNKNTLPVTMSAMYEAVGLKNGQHTLHLKGIFGPSAAQLIGRFADGHQPINSILTDLAQHEETYFKQQGIELAEIVHLPESRTGNILFRPAFRKYEIPYLAKSLSDKSHQLEISDLMISVRNGEIILRSKKLNKRILPRLGNAHNFQHNALPIYHFLADLQFQNLNNSLSFDWGVLRTEFRFLPRITYKGIILSRAEWNLSKKDIQQFKAQPSIALNRWKEIYKLPTKVYIISGDNELLINFNDPISLNLFTKEIKKYDQVTLKEYLFCKDNTLVKDDSGHSYTNEFIAFLFKNADSNLPKHIFLPNTESVVQRNFHPGSEWLYFKIYCGFRSADKILTEYLLPFIETLEKTKKIKKWFFIRYTDPKAHIRFRILVKDKKDIGALLCRFNEIVEPLKKHEVINKIQLDTYTRELERYGANSIQLAESFFFFDSWAITNFLTLIEGELGEKYRCFFALLSINQLLEDFNFNIQQKVKLLETLKSGFAAEFNVKKTVKDQINQKYRKYRKEIAQLFEQGSSLRIELEPALLLLENRSRQLDATIKEYVQLSDKNTLLLSIENLMASFIHMTCNRIFISNQRKHELVLYDFLYKIYKAEEMKDKKIIYISQKQL